MKRHFAQLSDRITVQNFSSLTHDGLDELITQLDCWFEWENITHLSDDS